MSDDIPIIFADDILNPGRAVAPTAVFMSAASASQMQQYATAGWRVLTAPGFKSSADIKLASVPAAPGDEKDFAGCKLLSCEVPFLDADAGSRIAAWRPEMVKFNCAFHNVADASSLAASVAGMGYAVIGAYWRDDNSFGVRSLVNINMLATFPAPDWDRMNIIGVRDAKMAHALLSVGRLYAGEETRIGELRVANSIRNDHIARLEEALAVHQSSGFKSPPS
jgi:hypothetical protein